MPLDYAVIKVAERWHQHPEDVDPRNQRPRRARWFWWALEVMDLEARFGQGETD